MSKYKIIKNTGIYSFVSVFQKAINLLLLPLYTIYLTQTEVGIIGIVFALINFLANIYLLSLHAAVNRFFFKYENKPYKLASLYKTNVVCILLSSMFFTTGLLLFREIIFDYLAKGIDFYPYILLGVISAFFKPLYILLQSLLQTEQKGVEFGKQNVAYFLINIFLTVIFLVVFKLACFGVLLSIAITNIILGMYSFYIFSTYIKNRFSVKILKESFTYSLPLIPHSLAGWSLSLIDRLLINGIKSTASVGLYTIGFQFGNIVNIIGAAINKVYVPWYFRNIGKKVEINEFSKLIVICICIFATIISLFSNDVLRFFVSNDFYKGWVVIPFIAFAYVFNSLYYIFSTPLLQIKNGTRYMPIISISVVILNTILNIVIIPYYGIIGASVATLISNVFGSLVALVIVKIKNVNNMDWIKMYIFVFIMFFISLINFINDEWSFLMFISKLLLVTILVVIIAAYYKMNFKNLFNFIKFLSVK